MEYINQQYTRYFEKIEAVLDIWLPETPDAAWLERVFGARNAPVPGERVPREALTSPELALSLTRPGRDLVSRGGKRWRPLLMVLAAESIAGEKGGDAALPLTPLVEFPHNASLIHDDIEDNSEERRGKPAVHLLYGTDTAINSGAFMYFLPLACLSAWADGADRESLGNSVGALSWAAESGEGPCAVPALKERIWQTWASHMRALHLGQAMDIAWHRDFYSLPRLDEYDRMCRLKTGCLARLASVLGVYCAGGCLEGSARPPASALENLADIFGAAAEQLGVGFQILDDVKNLDTGVPGKKRGDDIVEGKKSLPVLLYLHRHPEKRDFAARCFSAARSGGVNAPELEEFISALEEAGVLEEAREKAYSYIRKSREIFSAPLAAGIPLREEGRRFLADLIDMLA